MICHVSIFIFTFLCLIVKWENDGCDDSYSYDYDGPCCDCDDDDDPNPIKKCVTSDDCAENETLTRCCGGPDGTC